MEKKEYYKYILPHFQLPGQAYFVTWCLKDAVPAHALKSYSEKLQVLRSQLFISDSNFPGGNEMLLHKNSLRSRLASRFLKSTSSLSEIDKLKQEYDAVRRKYIKAFDDLLHQDKKSIVDLSKAENLEIVKESLCLWEGKKLKNFAFCIMPNHIHWVFQLFVKDVEGKFVYLEDILHSVKRFSSKKINKLEHQEGALWQKESFDTTIRNERHLLNAIEYTLNNPRAAKLVKNRIDWAGSKTF